MKRYITELANAEKKLNANKHYSELCAGTIGKMANARIDNIIAYHGRNMITAHEAAKLIVDAYDYAVNEIKTFHKQYSFYYEKYYTGQYGPDRERAAIEWFDGKNYDPDILSAFIEYTSDFVSSDREAAAFAETCIQYNYLK